MGGSRMVQSGEDVCSSRINEADPALKAGLSSLRRYASFQRQKALLDMHAPIDRDAAGLHDNIIIDYMLPSAPTCYVFNRTP